MGSTDKCKKLRHFVLNAWIQRNPRTQTIDLSKTIPWL